MRLYYSSITEREGSWQKSDGYILSNSKSKLESAIKNTANSDPNCEWEFSDIETFEATSDNYELFISRADDEILWITDFELEKYK